MAPAGGTRPRSNAQSERRQADSVVAHRDHHYVPQFYLRQFATASTAGARTICVHAIDRNATFRGASIKDQCYRPWFYGRDGEVESGLEQFESAAALAVRAVAESRVAPSMGSEHDQLLRLFVGIQNHRTSRRLSDLRTGDTKFVEVVFGGDPGAAEKFFGGEFPGMNIIDLLNLAPLLIGGMADLSCIVVDSGGAGGLLTSDHPVVLYNQYCEAHGEGWGSTGATTKGLQVFLPLSTRACLVFFDPGTYFIPARSRDLPVRASPNDLDAINSLQVLSAERCLYFPEETSEARVVQALKRARALRESFGPRVTEAIAEDDSRSSLIHMYIAVPNLKLNLSFLKLLPAARSVPAPDRLNQYRPEATEILRALDGQAMGPPDEDLRPRSSGGRFYRTVRTI
jgi:hypothetical protein